MRGVEGAASFSFRGKFPGHFLPLSQAKNPANKPLLHTVKRKPPAVHLYSQAAASPLCVISEAVRKPWTTDELREAARGSRTVSESDTAMQGIRSMDPLALERLIERFVRSGHPGGYRKVWGFSNQTAASLFFSQISPLGVIAVRPVAIFEFWDNKKERLSTALLCYSL